MTYHGRRGVTATIAILATVVLSRAQPYDPKAVFYSDSVLRGALENIAQMQEPELRAFTHYLAECQETIDPSSKHACAAAVTTYEIEFGNKRALDDLIYAKSNMDQLPPEKMDTARIFEIAKKHGLIIAALEQAASSRFHVLKTTRK
jgi:hypothetical protein